MSLCSSIKAEYEKLQDLKTRFLEVFANTKPTDDLADVKRLHKEWEAARASLESKLYVSIESAIEILGEKEVLGPDAVEKTWGVKLEKVPPLPFSREELERAKELGMFLILRIEEAGEGKKLTMENMNGILAEEFEKTNHGKILYSVSWYTDEDFFKKETPKLSWALVSKEMIPDSNNKNYLEQTEIMIDHITKKVFKEGALPKEYQDAIKEFSEKKEEISKLMKDDWREAAKILEELRITKLTRQLPVEWMYDTLVYFKNTEERLFETTYTWTSRRASRASDGRLVVVGNFDADGAHVFRYTPAHSYGDLGVAFSRGL